MQFDPEQVNAISHQVKRVLSDRVQALPQGQLAPQQLRLMDGCLDRLLNDHNGVASSVTDAEIEGVWEMVTEHLFPPELVELSKLMESQQKEGE